MFARSWKNICLWLLLGIGSLGTLAADRVLLNVQPDSARKGAAFSEYNHIYKMKKVSSTYPIKIEMKGRSLLVTSKHTQMLPVYKGNGVFYGLFRLNKGTNWISGLPRGTYIINNSKITIS